MVDFNIKCVEHRNGKISFRISCGNRIIADKIPFLSLAYDYVDIYVRRFNYETYNIEVEIN